MLLHRRSFIRNLLKSLGTPTTQLGNLKISFPLGHNLSHKPIQPGAKAPDRNFGVARHLGVVATNAAAPTAPGDHKAFCNTGDVSRCVKAWFNITSNNFIRNIVWEGYRLQFIANPTLCLLYTSDAADE